MKKAVIFPLFAILAGGGFFILLRDSSVPRVMPETADHEDCGSGVCEISDNLADSKKPSGEFSEEGNLLNFDSESGKALSIWRLLYEKPGASALSVDLVIDAETACRSAENQAISCDSLANGLRVKVDGEKTGGRVIARKLEVIR